VKGKRKTVNFAKKLGSILLVIALVVGGMQISSIEANAATKKVTKITLSADRKTLYAGAPAALSKTTIKVSIKPSGASKKVKFKSTKPKVATVNSNGKVTAKKKGTTYIVVTAKDGSDKSAKIKITVKKYVKPTSLSVKADSTSLTVGNTTTVKASFKPSNTSWKDVTYTSSDQTLATVSNKGIVTANSKGKTGTVTITVKSKAKTAKKKYLTQKVKIEIKTIPDTGVALNSTARTMVLTGTSSTTSTTLTATVSPANATNKTVSWSSSDSTIASVNASGTITAKSLGSATITAKTKSGKYATCKVTVKKSTVAIHDPSLFIDPATGKYYVTGTGSTTAVSQDLKGLTLIKGSGAGVSSSNKLFKNDYLTEFKEVFDYVGKSTELWAADIIYNTYMKKYCMYICTQNNTWTAAICMLTADNVEGPYSFAGTIVCSDFTQNSIEKTNIRSAIGLSSTDPIPARYYDSSETGTVNSTYFRNNFPDAIDPAPYYGHDGNLYMTYGSFTAYGGIYTLKLDPKTGLRSTGYNYSYEAGVSDPYFGKKIGNANGEGPYIQQIASSKSSTGYYYFLWWSTGQLKNCGGYNMRLLRSENPDGPFVDPMGQSATSTVGKANLGLRVMDNYKFSFMQYAHMAAGGNSAAVDKDGKIFLTYHNKFSDGTNVDDNPGWHMVKTNQMFLNEDGWLVTAPFEYNGETIKSSYDKSEVIGVYEFIYHRTSYTNTNSTTNYDYVDSERIELKSDGTVTGAYTGTWVLNGNYITVTVNGKEYKGVVLEQSVADGSNASTVTMGKKTMVFTAIGTDNRTVWGCKINATDSEATAYDASQISISTTASENIALPTLGLYGSTISWTSDNAAVVIDGDTGVITPDIKDVTVTLTAKVQKGTQTITKTYKVTVPAIKILISSAVRSNYINLPATIGTGINIVWTSSNTNVITNDGHVTQPAAGSVTVKMTATIGTIIRTYDVIVLSPDAGSYLYSQDYESVTDALTWTSTNAQDYLKLLNNTLYGNYIQFAPGDQNSRGAYTNFGVISGIESIYTMEFDVSLKAGDNQETNFAISGIDMAYMSGINDGIKSGYILKLAAQANSTSWKVNDSATTVDIPADWVHVQVVADTGSGIATVTITDDSNEYFNQAVEINGDGVLKGLYVRGGRYNSVTKVDNIKVY